MRIKTTEHIKDMKYKRVKGGFFYGEKWVAVDDMVKRIEKTIEGFKKYRKGVIRNSQLVKACDCFLNHLKELRDELNSQSNEKVMEEGTPIIDYKTKLLSRIDIIDMELEEGKITKKQYKEIKQKLLSEIKSINTPNSEKGKVKKEHTETFCNNQGNKVI